MKIYREETLRSFDFWSGGKRVADYLWDKFGGDAFDTIEREWDLEYPDGMDETQVNDMFWFETDYIATLLGYRNWEHLERGDDPIKIKCTNIEWDIDEDDDATDLPTDVEILLEDKDDIGDYLEDEEYYIAEWLSNEYGFCVDGYSFEEEDGE